MASRRKSLLSILPRRSADPLTAVKRVRRKRTVTAAKLFNGKPQATALLRARFALNWFSRASQCIAVMLKRSAVSCVRIPQLLASKEVAERRSLI